MKCNELNLNQLVRSFYLISVYFVFKASLVQFGSIHFCCFKHAFSVCTGTLSNVKHRRLAARCATHRLRRLPV